MKDQDTWQRYIDRTDSEAARKEMLDWLQSASTEQLEASLAQGWDQPAGSMPAGMAVALEQQLRRQGVKLAYPARSRYLRYLGRTAAAASIALLAGSLFWWQRPAKKLQPLAVHSRQIANNSAHVRKLTLSDGSQIWLTPGSSLSVPDDYNTRARIVTLSGEGYFEVAPRTTPFHVNAGGLEATVLGTHFNIEAYPGEHITGIALSAGSISVKVRPDSSLVLTPGLKLTYQQSTHRFTTRHFVPEKETDWKRGAFVLDDVPLDAAFSRLEKRFSKKIVFAPSAQSSARFTATYHTETLSDILQNMAFIYGFQYQETRDTVFIH
ncbi:FecR family protein [Chitinophaga sp. HK235]|uniref:FecR family protein n=1 Tax=Chitinophaga sp. HK235 TaxID=2952571 RepID=UPI001BABBA36|nr:FecR domain-containing protein [Chitinophaga sp. HK235]